MNQIPVLGLLSSETNFMEQCCETSGNAFLGIPCVPVASDFLAVHMFLEQNLSSGLTC